MHTAARWSVIGIVCFASLTRAQSCHPFWSGLAIDNPYLPLTGYTSYETYGDVGDGRTIFVSSFSSSVLDVATWKRDHWEHLGVPGLSPTQAAAMAGAFLEVLDDGSGPRLYALRHSGSARWEGAAWAPLPMQIFVTNGNKPIASVDLGNGARIYGLHRDSTAHVAWWDGALWHDVGTYLGFGGGNIAAMVRFDDGTGPALYVFGYISSIDGILTNGFLKWDGQTWSCPSMDWRCSIGGHTNFPIFDDGTGPAIYTIQGYLTSAPDCWIKKWDGHQWTCFGQLDLFPGQIGAADVLQVFDDGRGPALYIGGYFQGVNGHPARNLIRYDGRSWEEVGGGVGIGGAWHNGVIDDARGSSLLIGYDGPFNVGGGTVDGAVLWTGCAAPQCYANCDRSTLSPKLNVLDFICFLNKFAANDPYANCDQSTITPAINISDFVCFLDKFAAGCP